MSGASKNSEVRKKQWLVIMPFVGMLASTVYFAMLIMVQGVPPDWRSGLLIFALIGIICGAITIPLFYTKCFAAFMLRRAIAGATIGLVSLFPWCVWNAAAKGVPSPQEPSLVFVPITFMFSFAGGCLGALFAVRPNNK